jgi:hypothetical protein
MDALTGGSIYNQTFYNQRWQSNTGTGYVEDRI